MQSEKQLVQNKNLQKQQEINKSQQQKMKKNNIVNVYRNFDRFKTK